jgi:hypothetical protein
LTTRGQAHQNYWLSWYLGRNLICWRDTKRFIAEFLKILLQCQTAKNSDKMKNSYCPCFARIWICLRLILNYVICCPVMMIVVFSAPLFFLCSYLAFLCFRKAHYQHSVVLGLVATFMLVLTVSVLFCIYFLGIQMSLEIS